MSNLFLLNLIAIVLMLCIGLYTLIMAKNLIRILIGFEIMAKAVTLALISAGTVNGKLVLSQVLAITVIVIEVVFVAVALAIIMLINRKKQSLDVRKLTDLKG
jgi:NADH:ubiquinone oxidoreductase subunit K